jgi:hypothetical protein
MAVALRTVARLDALRENKRTMARDIQASEAMATTVMTASCQIRISNIGASVVTGHGQLEQRQSLGPAQAGLQPALSYKVSPHLVWADIRSAFSGLRHEMLCTPECHYIIVSSGANVNGRFSVSLALENRQEKGPYKVEPDGQQRLIHQ